MRKLCVPRYSAIVFGIFRRQNPNFHDDGLFLLARVLTNKNKEIIPVRLSKTSEMSEIPGGRFVRKVLVGPETLDQAILEVTTNRGHKVTQAVIEGGKFVPVKEWRK
ncbi:MAG: hypothetical protein CMO31_04790 [Trueperaceae bacterium]|nr:hypothetical protein [Trueperaceae bacterium]